MHRAFKANIPDTSEDALNGLTTAILSQAAAREKAKQVAQALWNWLRIRTNNAMERLNREIRRKTRVAGAFLDGNSAPMPVCARLCHVTGTQWDNKKYMNMKHLEHSIPSTGCAAS